MIHRRLETIPGFEAVHRFEDKGLGVVAFVAMHSSALGVPLGGCRVRADYADESDALSDALRLAEGMTRKAAIHGLALGGGKMVVWCRAAPSQADRKALFEFVGMAVERLGGAYVTAEDVNTTVDDMRVVRSRTEHVSGIDSGDPSEFTSLGVWESIKFMFAERLGADLAGCRLAVQGVGKVGLFLIEMAARAGLTNITVSDVDAQRADLAAKEYGAAVCPANEIYDVQCDAFAPCGPGASLDADSISRLRCCFVAGAANNQLSDTQSDEILLRRRRIAYCPDVVVNGGGMINVSCEFPSYDRDRALRLTRRIPNVLDEVLHYAATKSVGVTRAVRELTDARLASAVDAAPR